MKDNPRHLSRRDFLKFAGLALAGAGCTPTVQKTAEVLATLAPTETLTPTATHTAVPTDVLAPTPTQPEPTATPTPEVPTHFNNTELLIGMRQDFLVKPEIQGRLQEIKQSGNYDTAKSDFELVIESYLSDPNYDDVVGYGAANEYAPFTSHARDYVVVGSSDISLANLPGFDEDDRAKTMYLANPYEPNVLVPVLLGVNRNGYWEVIDRPYAKSLPTSQDDKVNFEAEGGLDAWSKGMEGKLMKVGIILYFAEEGDWQGPEFFHLDNKEVGNLFINIPSSYLQRFTEDPEKYLPVKMQRNWAFSSLEELVSNLDPNVDFGLIMNEWYVKG